MKRNKWIAFLFLLPAIFVLYSASGWAVPQKAELSSFDCVKCHEAQPAQIDANGGRHKTITCQDCHMGHRPSSKKNIPDCNMCHMGMPHFEIKGCLNCHRNPHTPLKITFSNNLTDPCLTCHQNQIKQLREKQSKHTKQACSKCHDVHGKKPECTQCHKPHSAEIKAADCKKCHAAHAPKNVTYAADISPTFCAACHKKQNKLLTASVARHSSLACAFCHMDVHKTVPKCQDCHGEKHPKGITARFSKCGDCHGIAHDLNNYKPEPVKESTKAKKKKK